MEVTPSDVLKVMKSPPIWEDYKKIINKAEGHEVKCCILELHIIVSGFFSCHSYKQTDWDFCGTYFFCTVL